VLRLACSPIYRTIISTNLLALHITLVSRMFVTCPLLYTSACIHSLCQGSTIPRLLHIQCVTSLPHLLTNVYTHCLEKPEEKQPVPCVEAAEVNREVMNA
jgi:hypothetical protein